MCASTVVPRVASPIVCPAARPVAAVVGRRVTALLLSAALLWSFACRPAWTSDGKHVAGLARRGEETVVVRHDVDSGHGLVLLAPADGWSPLGVAWRSDRGEWVVVSGAKDGDGTRDRRNALRIDRLTLAGAPVAQRVLEIGETARDVVAFGPVVVGGALWIGGREPRRIDLDTFAVAVMPSQPPEAYPYTLLSHGEAVLCLDRLGAVGRVDLQTLQPMPLCRLPERDGWQTAGLPAFASDPTRVAWLVKRPSGVGGKASGKASGEAAGKAAGKAADGARADGGSRDGDGAEEHAILLLVEGRIEVELPLGREFASSGSLTWAGDDVRVFTPFVRDVEGRRRMFLLEWDTTTMARREIAIGDLAGQADDGSPRSFDLAVKMLQAAVSPDGRWLAFGAAGLGMPAAPGLVLVDLDDDDRPITRVAVPD